jgi:hypothetical protein
VEHAGPHPRGRARAHRGWQLARPGDPATALSIAPPCELVDATTDGILLLQVGIVRVGVEVGITLVGIDAEDGEAGATVRTAEVQQRRPHHPQGACTSSPPLRGRKRKPRKEDAAAAAASDLVDAEAARVEDAALREAIAKSLEDLIRTDNSMPMDAALAWSRQDWEREQAEQQRRLLDLATARCRAAAAAQPSRGAPVVKLEDSSDDDLYQPMPPRFGDAGQGSSRWTPGQSSQQVLPPQDDGGNSSDDYGSDYMVFYRHLAK